MKAAELRVGNLIYNETIKEVMEVYPMMIPQIKQCELAGEHNIKPIPLTEDWLFKFGFDKMDSEASLGMFETKVGFYGFHADFIYDYIIYRDGIWILRTADGDENDKTQFVHQLQNLFFALTGEELKEPSNEPAETQR